MPAPTISHIIATGALVGLLFTVQVFYLYVIDNIEEEMARRELKEITDYVSDTLANLYILANTTNVRDVRLEKILNLPSEISGSTYLVQITFNGTTQMAQSVNASLQGKSWVNSVSWLLPGLKVNSTLTETVQSSDITKVVGCERVYPDVYVWIAPRGG